MAISIQLNRLSVSIRQLVAVEMVAGPAGHHMRSCLLTSVRGQGLKVDECENVPRASRKQTTPHRLVDQKA